MKISRHNARHYPRHALRRKTLRSTVHEIIHYQERFVTREIVPGPTFAAAVRDFNALYRALLKIRKRNANPPGSRRFKRLLTDEEADKKFREDLERAYGQIDSPI